ncbi:MAG: type II toxin-antitoxin system RatA family toxin [Pseudomonadota bacterium]
MLRAMPEIERSALVPHSAEAMFALVNDVPSYPQFLNWCRSTNVLENASDAMVAEVQVSIAGIRQSFTTRNQLQPFAQIDMHAVDGPFEQFVGRWTFDPLGDDGCKVVLKLRFELASEVLASAFAGGFSWVAKRLVGDFVDRAYVVHG